MRHQMMLDVFLPNDGDDYRMRLLMAEVKMAQGRLERARDDLAEAQRSRSQVTMAQWLSARDDVRGETAAKFG